MKENIPIVLIDKENIQSKTLSSSDFSGWRSFTLKKIALVVPIGSNSYKILSPKDAKISDCTIVHISQLYLSVFDDFAAQDPIQFEGTLVELLEKYKSHDDVQIFFIASVRVSNNYQTHTDSKKSDDEYVDSETCVIVRSVLDSIFHNYNDL